MSQDNPINVDVSEFARDAASVSLDPNSHDGLGYFAHFGVTEKLIRDGMNTALSRGGDWAELYFEHRVGHHVGLEDGAVNRAYSSVSLGVGIRVIRDDQTGYACFRP